MVLSDKEYTYIIALFLYYLKVSTSQYGYNNHVKHVPTKDNI